MRLNQNDGLKGSSRPRAALGNAALGNAALGNADAARMSLVFELFSSFTIAMHRLSIRAFVKCTAQLCFLHYARMLRLD